jgi:hypothetical protein
MSFSWANKLSSKIGKLIAEHRSESLSSINPRSRKELWSSVTSTIKSCNGKTSLRPSAKYRPMFEDVDAINANFADTATDSHYDSRVIEQIVSSLSQKASPDLELLNEYDVFQMLSKVKKTSSGYDHLPYWLFRECAGLLSSVIKHLFNNILLATVQPHGSVLL